MSNVTRTSHSWVFAMALPVSEKVFVKYLVANEADVVQGKIVDFMTLEEAHKANIGNLSLPATHYKVFPVVEFLPGKHVSVRTPKRVLVTAGEADVKNPNGSLRARRTQVPLILAW